MGDLTTLLLFAGSILISFFLSGMEAGVFAVSRLRVRQLSKQGNAQAQLLHKYLDHPEDFLWTILVGSTLSYFVSITLLVTTAYKFLAGYPWLYGLSLACAAILLYAFGDLLPKMLFRLYPNRLSLRSVAIFRLIHLLLRPIVALISALGQGLLRVSNAGQFTGRLFGNRAELRLLMLETGSGLSADERHLINQVLDLPNQSVLQVMTPIEKAITLPVHSTYGELLALARQNLRTHYPMTQGGRVTGILHLPSVLFDPPASESVLASTKASAPLILSQHVRLEESLLRMQRAGQRFAVVTDGVSKHLGVVSWQDLLKHIFGEVRL